MSRKLIESFEKKKNGNPDGKSIGIYVREISKIAGTVYEQKYGEGTFPWSAAMGNFHPEKRGRGKDGTKVRSESEFFEFSDGSPVVNPSQFEEACFEKVEKEFDRIMCHTYASDAELAGFLKTTFSHLLQEMKYRLTPGLKTRVRQLKRVLKQFCVEGGQDKGKKYWIAEGFPEQDATRAEFGKLLECAGKLRLPEVKYPKKAESAKGPSIKDDDMRRFLQDLFRDAGGAAYEQDLIDLIVFLFDLSPARRVVSFSAKGEDGGAENFDSYLEVLNVAPDAAFAPDHLLMARDLVRRMTPRMKIVRHLRFTEELTHEEIAGRLGLKSPSSVTGVLGEIEKLFTNYFLSPEPGDAPGSAATPQATLEEAEVVLSIVSKLIEEGMEENEQ